MNETTLVKVYECICSFVHNDFYNETDSNIPDEKIETELKESILKVL
jgi:hypothetical protein